MSEKISRDSWATPLPVYMAMEAEFDFAADICASDRNAKHPIYLTEADDTLNHETLQRMAGLIPAGNYVWCNPPYSDIGPWVTAAIVLQDMGIGVVMLVMADNSVGWYAKAIEFCQEVREVIKGRISFLEPETGKPVSGNNKGSLFFVFDPYGRQQLPRRTYVERDALMAKGQALMEQPVLLFQEATCAAG
ncbi:phage N-6-adenine-methyltransferase [Oceanisphaera sp. KMM 10153]|uniref:phage N-6-adenine-methyltransferase n=1 Tax=Oceanisphaera submarina TaxID=3390193 RepID=UPI003975A080